MTPMPLSLHWKVRPYFFTQGRTRVRRDLLVQTLVSVEHYDLRFAESLPPEARALYEHAQTRRTCSVAELSAGCGMPLGVTRVLVDDLAASGRLVIHPDSHSSRGSSRNLDLLERLRDGLLKLA